MHIILFTEKQLLVLLPLQFFIGTGILFQNNCLKEINLQFSFIHLILIIYLIFISISIPYWNISKFSSKKECVKNKAIWIFHLSIQWACTQSSRNWQGKNRLRSIPKQISLKIHWAKTCLIPSWDTCTISDSSTPADEFPILTRIHTKWISWFDSITLRPFTSNPIQVR